MTFTTHISVPLRLHLRRNVIVACLALLFIVPAAGQSRPTEAELAKEMFRHLVCFPMELLTLEQHLPAIATEDLCLAMIYHKTGARPLWVTADGPSPKASIILNYLENSYTHGLDPEEYKVSRIHELWSSKNASELAQLDTTLTYSLVKYVHDISYGQLKPLESDPQLFAEAGDKDFNPLLTIEHILATNDLDRFLAGLPPQHQHYRNLKTALDHYRQLAAIGGWPKLAAGNSLHMGIRDPRVVTVRQRLQITQDLQEESFLADPDLYDSQLEQAVRWFQKRHGLTPDGIVGPKTRTAMNITAAQKVDTFRINMARWRWHAHELGSKYILVNIASFNLKAFQDQGNETILDIPVIVGEEQHQTPVFSETIKYVDINPFWNITPGIAENEELPALRQNPFHLVERHIRLFSSWQSQAVELDSTSIDWHSVSKSQIRGYKLRQDPGPWNALGKIKFVFPNQYSVYMHDTPTPNLFKHTQRDFSHGCIRVSDPLALAMFVLDGQDGDWDIEKITELYNQDSRKVIQLSTPVPVHITYQTTWVDKDGTINFNRDIYARDAKLYDALL